MKNAFLIILFFSTASIVGGCAVMPPILVNAGYVKTAADVVSYATTKKGTVDHAVSAIAKKDCALHRVLSENGKVCIEKPTEVATINKTVIVKEYEIVNSPPEEAVIDTEYYMVAEPTISEPKKHPKSILASIIPKRKPMPLKQLVAEIKEVVALPPIVPIVVATKPEPEKKDEGVFTLAMRYIRELTDKVKNIDYSFMMN